MNETQRGYASYLLRLWQAQDNEDWVWRASLECSQTGRRWVFANLDEALAFLRKRASELATDQEDHEILPDRKSYGGRK